MNSLRLLLPCGLYLSVEQLNSECKEHANEFIWEVSHGVVPVRGYSVTFAEAKAKVITAAHNLCNRSAIILNEVKDK